MSKDIFNIILRFILLVLAQVGICNQMHLLGFLNPQVSLLFVLWFPLSNNKLPVLIFSFIFGLAIDIFCNSGGINAAACMFIAFILTPYIKILVRDKDLDYNLFNYSNYNLLTTFAIVFPMAFIHQLILYFLDYFSFSFLLDILLKSLGNSIFTTIIILMSLSIFRTKKQ